MPEITLTFSLPPAGLRSPVCGRMESCKDFANADVARRYQMEPPVNSSTSRNTTLVRGSMLGKRRSWARGASVEQPSRPQVINARIASRRRSDIRCGIATAAQSSTSPTSLAHAKTACEGRSITCGKVERPFIAATAGSSSQTARPRASIAWYGKRRTGLSRLGVAGTSTTRTMTSSTTGWRT